MTTLRTIGKVGSQTGSIGAAVSISGTVNDVVGSEHLG
jgi:hypothetical protein